LIRQVIQIEGMTCSGCETVLENALRKLDGVVEAEAFFSKSQVCLTYDANVIGLEQIIQTIEKLEYTVIGNPGSEVPAKPDMQEASEDKKTVRQLLGTGIILLALYLVIRNTVGFDFFPEIDPSMGYGMLFAVGVLTSLHCIAMCGGINLSQCVSYRDGNGNTGRFSNLRPGLLYNGGRVISYTVIGGIAGALGSGISFSGAARGIVAVTAGVFMVIMGLNMLNAFPWLRKLNPRMPGILRSKIQNGKGRRGPFYVGLLNGLMPCGPLQAMQIYALGTGSFVAGALSMFMFSMGTVPLVLGFGAASTILSSKFTRRMMKAGAVLVIVLGVVMAGRGLALSGFTVPSLSPGSASGVPNSNAAVVQDGFQTVTTKLFPGMYEPITVQKGIPLKWTIKARKGDINGCNNEIVIPAFDISKKLEAGDNIIEFTPDETGTFTYSCWMGMIRSRITVVEDITDLERR